jgi:hypothetical protein
MGSLRESTVYRIQAPNFISDTVIVQKGEKEIRPAAAHLLPPSSTSLKE